MPLQTCVEQCYERLISPGWGHATLSTYGVNGMQYVVIATGGGKMETKSGNLYLAFSSVKKISIRNYFTNLHNGRFKRID